MKTTRFVVFQLANFILFFSSGKYLIVCLGTLFLTSLVLGGDGMCNFKGKTSHFFIQSLIKLSQNIDNSKYEVSIHTQPHLKCIRLVSVRSSLPCINVGVRIGNQTNTFQMGSL